MKPTFNRTLACITLLFAAVIFAPDSRGQTSSASKSPEKVTPGGGANNTKLIEEKASYNFQRMVDTNAPDYLQLQKDMQAHTNNMARITSRAKELAEKVRLLEREKDNKSKSDYESAMKDLKEKTAENIADYKKEFEPCETLKAQFEWDQLLIKNKGYGPPMDEFIVQKRKEWADLRKAKAAAKANSGTPGTP